MENRINIRTNISVPYWCNREGVYEKARIPIISNHIYNKEDYSNSEISWLDALLDGGIYLPKSKGDKNRALTILICGPPGSGKSTMALELCRSLTNPDKTTGTEISFPSLYISSEANDDWIIQKANAYGWTDVERTFVGDSKDKTIIPLTTIWQTVNFHNYIEKDDQLPDTTSYIMEALIGIFVKIPNPSPLVRYFKNYWNKLIVKKGVKNRKPEVLVIDSLKPVNYSERVTVTQKFNQLISCGPKILIIILESDGNKEGTTFWEYISDIGISLDHTFTKDYYLRTIEIKKARYQSHVWGKHQLKILAPNKPVPKNREEALLCHPYRKEGGIQIFPSLHYYVSIYNKRTDYKVLKPYRTSFEGLDDILCKNLMTGTNSILLGSRGCNLNLFALYAALHQLYDKEKKDKIIIVSLQEEPIILRKTIEKIILDKYENQGDLKLYEAADRFEILYYSPGYITPEEFYHRLFMSMQRSLNNSNIGNIFCLFDGLDKLSSRFPLCAKNDIFIPSILRTFSAENITGFFIGIEEPGQPPEQYGMLSNADNIFVFRKSSINLSDYFGHINTYCNKSYSIEREKGHYINIISINIPKIVGGTAISEAGFLINVTENSTEYEIIEDVGLHFIPFSEKYKKGEDFYKIF